MQGRRVKVSLAELGFFRGVEARCGVIAVEPGEVDASVRDAALQVLATVAGHLGGDAGPTLPADPSSDPAMNAEVIDDPAKLFERVAERAGVFRWQAEHLTWAVFDELTTRLTAHEREVTQQALPPSLRHFLYDRDPLRQHVPNTPTPGH